MAIGIVIRAGRILICRRKKNDPFDGYWEFPGGKWIETLAAIDLQTDGA